MFNETLACNTNLDAEGQPFAPHASCRACVSVSGLNLQPQYIASRNQGCSDICCTSPDARSTQLLFE
jgi:hypothetical protein